MNEPVLDYYAILGVAPNSSAAEITRAYRALLRQHHPDTRSRSVHSDGVRSDAALQQVLAAYSVLHDPTRRADYDQRRVRRDVAAASASPPGVRTQPARAIPVRRRRIPKAPEPDRPIVGGPVRWQPPGRR
jgi:curved DNA-binding protein CbpA